MPRKRNRRTHRPFEDLTWPQIDLIRDLSRGGSRYSRHEGRTVYGLQKRKVPLVTERMQLTEAGKATWQRILEWRPDWRIEG